MCTRLILPALFCLSLSSGCALTEELTRPSEEEQREIDRKREIPTEVKCYVLEFNREGRERPRRRTQAFDRVEFNYTSSSDLQQTVGSRSPSHVFVTIHGWMNNAQSGQQFSSRWVNGIRSRAKAGEAPLFVALHWDSEDPLFQRSAARATQIGKRRVAGLLKSLRSAAPKARITVIGHSLGARAMISALHYSDARYADAALLVQGAANLDWLHGDMGAASARATRIANVYSIHDSVLEEAYAKAMLATALGRVGAERATGELFVRYELQASFSAEDFGEALANAGALGSGGGRVVNVDASNVITGHTDIDHDALYDLAWALAR